MVVAVESHHLSMPHRSSQDARRRLMFAAGALALSRVRPGLPGPAYACPLCLRGFVASALDAKPPDLTLEHAPPRSADTRKRPKPVALVCRDCNSTGGHELDAELVRQNVAFDFALLGKSRFQTQLRVGPETFATTVHVDGKRLHVDVVPKANRADAKERLDGAIAALRSGKAEYHLELPTFHERRSQISLLRAAYVATFAKFGYSWALTPALQPVRQQIAEPDSYALSRFVAILPDADPAQLMLAVAKDSNGDAFVLATIGRYLVILPGVGHQSAQSLCDELVGTDLADLGTLSAFKWPAGLELLLDQPTKGLPP